MLTGGTLANFREMHLELICREMLMEHPVVSAVESDAIVIDLAVVFDELVQMT